MKPPPPELPDDPLADQEPLSLSVLRKKTRAELDLIPYVEKLWTCAAEGCKCHTTVRDYGHFDQTGHVYWRRRFMWLRSYYYLCSRHTKIERKFWQTFNRRNTSVAAIVDARPFALKPRREHHVLTIKIPKDATPH